MRPNPYLELCVPGVASLSPYVPGKPVSELEREFGIRDSIKLASNENSLGPSPRALQVIRNAAIELARYPDGSGGALRGALSRRYGISPESFTLGNGSNDVLDMVARVFLGPGIEAIFSEHAFAVYPICTQAVGATARVSKAQDGTRGPRFGHDLEAMASLVNDRTRVVFVANPNNPTGTMLSREELEEFLERMPPHVIVVVDEAYFEYATDPDYPDALQWLPRFPNLVVTRTFSKAYGLAALRVGFGVSHPQIADLLNRVRHPFNVNSLALEAAEAALGDREHLAASLEVNHKGMVQLTEGLRSLGLDFVPSHGNFLLVDLGRPAAEIDSALLRRGCITRPVANYGLPSHLRVTVGLAHENERFLTSLAEVL